MAGWGNNRWGGNESYEDDQYWKPTQGLSAASYNFHRNTNKQANRDHGAQKWEYNPAASASQWSTAADDDDGYNQPTQFDYNRNTRMQPNPSQSMYNNNLPFGWRNTGDMGHNFQNQNLAPANLRGRNNRGFGRRYGHGDGNQMWQGVADGYQEEQPPRKRGRERRGRGGERGNQERRYQQQWGGDEYGWDQGGYGDSHSSQWWQGPMQDQSWNEDDDYYYGNQAYGEWSQIPPSSQPQTWEGQEEGYGEEVYTNQFDYGEGYDGGYPDPQQYYEDDPMRGKRMKRSRAGRAKPRVEDLPEDKLIYKKHRELAQDRDGRELLFRTIKSTMHAMREASDAMSLELKELLNPTPEEESATVEEDEASVEANKEQGIVEADPEQGGADTEIKDESADGVVKEAADDVKQNGDDKKDKELPPQLFLGVIRVGAAIRRLLSKDSPHFGAELVAVFKCKPTKSHLARLAELIKEKMNKHLLEKLVIAVKDDDQTIEITAVSETATQFPIVIRFTSPRYSKDFVPDESEEQNEEPEDLLDEKKCIEALAEIRRVRWAMLKRGNDLEKPVVRIFLDITTRLPGWKNVSPYSAEVLVHYVMNKLSKDVRESELHISRLFVQCLEVLAEGLVLPGGPGLKDPCDGDPVDVFSHLTPQEAEDLTRAAQNALRTVACGRLSELINVK